MALLDTFLHELTDRLSASGIRVLNEFEQPLFPLPADDLFVTAAVTGLRAEPPLSVHGGRAVPVQLTLRLRFHGRTEKDAGALPAVRETVLLPLLLDTGLAVTSADCGETAYVRAVDRFVCEAEFSLAGVFTDISSDRNEVIA